MSQSLFALSWESYLSNICSGFSSFQQNGELVDMTLAADGHLVKVHQVLIALASPYLKELITTVPTQHPVVFLNDVSRTTLCLILEYIYTGEVRVPAEDLSSFMKSAKALHIRGLDSITDNGNTTTRMDTSIDENSLDNTGVRKKSDQIVLPPNAKKVYFNINPDSSAVTYENFFKRLYYLFLWSVKKTLVASHDNNMHDCSDGMDDNLDDCSYNVDDYNKLDMPGKADNDKSILPAKDTTENSNLSSNLQFTVSIRGKLQVILNRYIYNWDSTQRSGIRRWRCTDYRYRKCPAFITTKENIVLKRAHPHNHSFHDKKILSKIEQNAVYSALDEVENLIVDDNNRNITEDSEFVSTTTTTTAH